MVFFFSGVGNGTRTHNARNHNPVLCQLNYTHHIKMVCQKELGKSRGGSVKPSPATLVRVAFDRSSLTKARLEMVRQKGLEPLTYCLEGSCSIQLSYWRI